MSQLFARRLVLLSVALTLLSLAVGIGVHSTVHADTTTNPQSNAIGLEGTIGSPPPTTPATIAVPGNGQSFSTDPITISGLCTDPLLVELFSNGVFIGSAQCTNGSYSIQGSLFDGQNQIVARVYDALDQAGPDSNQITVNFVNSAGAAAQQVLLTSSYAKRGATPGTQLTWPISISGGSPPYAVSIDWGDGSASDLLSQSFAGTINAAHAYKQSGVYDVLVKATDSAGNVGFLQLVGVGNGTITQSTSSSSGGTTGSNNGLTTTKTKVLWQPAALAVPLIIATFWLGRRYEITSLRKHLNESRDQQK